MEKTQQYSAVIARIPKRWAIATCAALLAAALAVAILRDDTVPDGPDELDVPSGQQVTFQELVQGERGPGGLTLRYRFVAPAIARDGGTVDFDAAAEDMKHLCQSYVLPRIANTGPQPAQIVISLSDRVIVFGETIPDATQYFEAYRVENGLCIWEGL